MIIHDLILIFLTVNLVLSIQNTVVLWHRVHDKSDSEE